ncbi:polysaccharide biosynthesis protein [Rossellomorea aquimaris]|uniref:polysaccharide biosynthesis protein n=1 Tax=Rossellomorea aquimaris TaxID=189382 RepID=UPI001CD451DD|nr:polysaccharide biosynthesis protein [Rossellomorea aquimaris]MCA1055429.1 polysaccharide biosynthesis protein [Rossellomorea aquimaris]
MFKDMIILVTGATGSWGYELVRQLLRFDPKEVRLFSRNEYAQVKMKRLFQHQQQKLTFTIGDVRDYHSLLEACKDVDYVFHLAALKSVPICEEQPLEALKTNVTGTENVIRASMTQGVKKVIDVSSDKAVSPNNLYGMTKAIGEKLIVSANQSSSGTKFVCIRGGNVLGTNGSVVPFFKELIENGKDIPITSKEMTRFFLTIEDAIQLLFTAAMDSIGGETFVMKMKACKIVDLAEVMIDSLSKESLSLVDVGIRPGEKINEVLISEHESSTSYEYSQDYYIILPANASEPLQHKYSHLPKVKIQKYESNLDLMNKAEIKELLLKGGFLS